MDLMSAILLKSSASLIKNIIDDIYKGIKDEGSIKFNEWRASLKERAVAKSISQITHVKTLWNIEKEVSIYEIYYPSRLEISPGVTKEVSGLKDIGIKQNFVIQGTGGQGKSIFLRYLCGQELQVKHSSNRLPFFIELKRIQAGIGLNDLIHESLLKYKLNPCEGVFDTLARSGKIVLLLDAFDEVAPSEITKCIGEIENIADRYKDELQIIITSRPDTDIQHSSRFRLCRLCRLGNSDHLPFLKKICVDTVQANNLHKAIQTSKAGVAELLTTPLMMTLLVVLYKSSQTIPDSVPRFYEELFDVMFFRHDNAKPGFRRKRYTNLEDTSIKTLFSAFCFYARVKNYGTLTSDQFNECCDLATKACGISVDSKLFRDEIVKTICLMLEEGFELSFIHKSVFEYYSAAFVKRSNEEFAKKLYSTLSGDNLSISGWQLTISFLSYIDEYRYSKYFVLPLLSKIEIQYAVNLTREYHVGVIASVIEKFKTLSRIRLSQVNGNIYKLSGGWERTMHQNSILDAAHSGWLSYISMGLIKLNKEYDLSDLVLNAKMKLDNHPDEKNIVPSVSFFDIWPFVLIDIIQGAEKNAFDYLLQVKFNAESIVNREDQNALFIEELLPKHM